MEKILKGAVVLLITAAMVFSTVAVTADTAEEEISSACGNINKNIGSNPQIQDTILIPYSNDRTDLFAQYPLGPDDPEANSYTSDVLLDWKVYDDFWDIYEPICDIHWWGFTMYWAPGWEPGDPVGMTFDITFYNDIEGYPGDVVCYYENIPYSVSGTGIYYTWGGYEHELLYFEADLNPCCSISYGWVSIQSTYSPNDYSFLWMNSKDGNLFCWQNENWWYYDVSFILTGMECDPSIDVEKEVWDNKNQEWVDADTRYEAHDVCICNEITFRITVTNTGTCPLYNVKVYDIMHDSLKYISADPEPHDFWYEEPYYYMIWYIYEMDETQEIEIYITAHVEGPECSYDVNHVDADGYCIHGNYVFDEDECWIHAKEKAREFNTPILDWLQNHPNMVPLLQMILQRLGLY
ncbi:MAG: DUF11 domain-containing protein [Thermoplasmatales archaeon]|nr:MAG: DUF11 domain-containing protein [Thermoplasmatales archaeon]